MQKLRRMILAVFGALDHDKKRYLFKHNVFVQGRIEAMKQSDFGSRFEVRRVLLSATLLSTFAIVSPVASAEEAQANVGGAGTEKVTVTELTSRDRQLLDGVLFGVGPVAEDLGNSIVPLFTQDEYETVQGYIDETSRAFVAAKPEETAKAVDLLRSGSVNSTESGIETLGAAFTEYLTETYSQEELDASVEVIGENSVVPMCGVVAACAAAVYLAVYAGIVVHNAAAVTAAGAVVVSVYAWCGAWVGCSLSSQTLTAQTGPERVQVERFLAHATIVGAELPD